MMRGCVLFQAFHAQKLICRSVLTRNASQLRYLASQARGGKTNETRNNRRILIPAALVACGSAVAGALLYHQLYSESPEQQQAAPASATKRSTGKVALGCEWTLTDQHGNERKSSDFHGKFVLLYFGLTHCPDVCPVEVAKMCSAVEKVERFANSKQADAGKLYPLVPIMISVDPERDTPEVLKRYCDNYSPKMVGLTSTPEQIEQVARSFRVYHSRTRSSNSDDESDYLVDHTIVTYLIGPSGEFVDYYGQYKPAEDIAGSVILHMLEERSKSD